MEEPSEEEISIFREMDDRLNMLPVLETKENETIQDLAERENNNERRVIKYLADKHNSTPEKIKNTYMKVFVHHQKKGEKDAAILQGKLHDDLDLLVDEVVINYNTLGIIIWLKYQIMGKIDDIPKQIKKDIIKICSFFKGESYDFERLAILVKYPKNMKGKTDYPKIFQIELNKETVIGIGEDKNLNMTEIQKHIGYTDVSIRKYFYFS